MQLSETKPATVSLPPYLRTAPAPRDRAIGAHPLDAMVALLDVGGVAIALFDDAGVLRAATRRWRTLLGEDADGGQVWRAAQRVALEVALESPGLRVAQRASFGAVPSGAPAGAAAHAASTTIVTARGRYRLRVAAIAAPERGAMLAAVHLTRDGDPADAAAPAARPDRLAGGARADGSRRTTSGGGGGTAMLPMSARRATAGATALADEVAAGTSTTTAPTGLAALTARERAVALLVAGGATLAVAAGELGISAHTARHHLERVYAKLSVRTRADLSRRLAESES
jgi:DNA-binding CsgD family transcriptional regulator